MLDYTYTCFKFVSKGNNFRKKQLKKIYGCTKTYFKKSFLLLFLNRWVLEMVIYHVVLNA